MYGDQIEGWNTGMMLIIRHVTWLEVILAHGKCMNVSYHLAIFGGKSPYYILCIVFVFIFIFKIVNSPLKINTF